MNNKANICTEREKRQTETRKRHQTDRERQSSFGTHMRGDHIHPAAVLGGHTIFLQKHYTIVLIAGQPSDVILVLLIMILLKYAVDTFNCKYTEYLVREAASSCHAWSVHKLYTIQCINSYVFHRVERRMTIHCIQVFCPL